MKPVPSTQPHTCQRGCSRNFDSIQQLRNHYRRNHISKKRKRSALQDDSLLEEGGAMSVQGQRNGGPVQNTSRSPIEINISSNESSDTFTIPELFTLKFAEICDTYGISREATRELVYLNRTMVEYNAEKNPMLDEEYSNIPPASLLFPENLVDTLKKRTNLATNLYDICINGCSLFYKETELICPNQECKQPRYHSDGTTPQRQWKMFSLARVVAMWLSNKETREMMRYRHQFQPSEEEYSDIFSGKRYTRMRENGLFDNQDDVALGLFCDDFTATKSNQSAKLTLINVVNYNLDPSIRYRDAYTQQLGIIPGPNKGDITSFLRPIVDEAMLLQRDGLLVLKDGNVECACTCHLLIATGDLPASAELACHKGHNAQEGCRICRIVTIKINYHTCFLERSSIERPISDFKAENYRHAYSIKKPSPFQNLMAFDSPLYFGLDVMHELEHNLSKTIYEMITVSLGKDYNSALKYMYRAGEQEYVSDSTFPFFIEKADLLAAGELIAKSKPFVNVSFASKWVDPIKYNGGIRAIDRKIFLLYQVPTFFVPLIKNNDARIALLKLIKATALAVQWNVSKSDLKTIQLNFKNWFDYLLEAIRLRQIKPGACKATQHYLLHIARSIEMNGCLPSYSCFSLERAIGRYKRLLKSKSSVGENASNVMEKLCIFSYADQLTDGLLEDECVIKQPRRYGSGSFRSIKCPDTNQEHQLWSPLQSYRVLSSPEMPLGIPKEKFLVALDHFYLRAFGRPLSKTMVLQGCYDIVEGQKLDDALLIGARAWENEFQVWSSSIYADFLDEHRRGNTFIMFEASHMIRGRVEPALKWYCGSICFAFQHFYLGVPRLLLLIELAEENGTTGYDSTIPLVKYVFSDHSRKKFAVIRVSDIITSVSLVKTKFSNKYKVIAKKIFRKSLTANAGIISNL